MLHVGAGHNNNCQIILKYTKSAKVCLPLLPPISGHVIIQLRGYFSSFLNTPVHSAMFRKMAQLLPLKSTNFMQIWRYQRY